MRPPLARGGQTLAHAHALPGLLGRCHGRRAHRRPLRPPRRAGARARASPMATPRGRRLRRGLRAARAAVDEPGGFTVVGRCAEGSGVEVLLDGRPHALGGWSTSAPDGPGRRPKTTSATWRRPGRAAGYGHPQAVLVRLPAARDQPVRVRPLLRRPAGDAAVRPRCGGDGGQPPRQLRYPGRFGPGRVRPVPQAGVHGRIARESYATRREVRDILVAALPVTLSLVIGGTILFLLIAIPVESSAPCDR